MAKKLNKLDDSYVKNHEYIEPVSPMSDSELVQMNEERDKLINNNLIKKRTDDKLKKLKEDNERKIKQVSDILDIHEKLCTQLNKVIHSIDDISNSFASFNKRLNDPTFKRLNMSKRLEIETLLNDLHTASFRIKKISNKTIIVNKVTRSTISNEISDNTN